MYLLSAALQPSAVSCQEVVAVAISNNRIVDNSTQANNVLFKNDFYILLLDISKSFFRKKYKNKETGNVRFFIKLLS